MTNNQKAYMAGLMIRIAQEDGRPKVESLALTAAAYELIGKRVQAAKHCPSEVEMTDAGFEVPDKDWLEPDAGQAVGGVANSNAGKNRLENANDDINRRG